MCSCELHSYARGKRQIRDSSSGDHECPLAVEKVMDCSTDCPPQRHKTDFTTNLKQYMEGVIQLS